MAATTSQEQVWPGKFEIGAKCNKASDDNQLCWFVCLSGTGSPYPDDVLTQGFTGDCRAGALHVKLKELDTLGLSLDYGNILP